MAFSACCFCAWALVTHPVRDVAYGACTFVRPVPGAKCTNSVHTESLMMSQIVYTEVHVAAHDGSGECYLVDVILHAGVDAGSCEGGVTFGVRCGWENACWQVLCSAELSFQEGCHSGAAVIVHALCMLVLEMQPRSCREMNMSRQCTAVCNRALPRG